MANPRKTQEAKELIGTARKDRPGADLLQPDPLDSLPDCPDYLNKTGRKQWKKYTKLLQNEQLLVETDLDSLGRYCFLLQVAEEAATELKQGVVRQFKDEQGRVYYANTPDLLKIFHEASTAALKLEQQFGFTPVSRKNVPVAKKKPAESKIQQMKRKHNEDRDSVFKLA